MNDSPGLTAINLDSGNALVNMASVRTITFSRKYITLTFSEEHAVLAPVEMNKDLMTILNRKGARSSQQIENVAANIRSELARRKAEIKEQS